MGRALRTAALLGVSSCAAAALVGACSEASNPPSSPGTAGEPSPGADADTRAVDSGTLDAAIDGASDSGDAADTSRWAPPPPACPARTFLDEDVIARAAVAAGGCFSDDGLARTTTYFRRVLGGYAYLGGEALITCLAAVTNGCDGVAACYGWSVLDAGQTCGTCVGATAVYCPSGSFKRLDPCDKFGGACDAGKCFYPEDPLCVGRRPFCNGAGQAVHCDDGRSYLGADCKGLGTTCVDPVLSNELVCEGLGSSCTPGSPPSSYYDLDPSPPNTGDSCKGDILEACVGNHSANLDCRCFGAGFSCRSAFGSAPDGGPFQTSFCGSASECEPRTFKRSCDGTTIELCNAGKIARIDCAAMGFQSCGRFNSAGEPRACVPAPGWVLSN